MTVLQDAATRLRDHLEMLAETVQQCDTSTELGSMLGDHLADGARVIVTEAGPEAAPLLTTLQAMTRIGWATMVPADTAATPAELQAVADEIAAKLRVLAADLDR